MVFADSERRRLLTLCLMYGAASLVHFIHNAELITDYPGLPVSWTRVGVYLVWLGMTAVGVSGWRLFSRGQELTGLLLLAGYALAGLDSLGHYVVAPFSAHTTTMHITILMEVTGAMLVLGRVIGLLIGRLPGKFSA